MTQIDISKFVPFYLPKQMLYWNKLERIDQLFILEKPATDAKYLFIFTYLNKCSTEMSSQKPINFSD